MADLLSDGDDALGGRMSMDLSDNDDADYTPKRKKTKRSRKSRSNKKSRMFNGKPKPPHEKVPPPNHFLNKLPAEIRNEIYSYVLDTKVWREVAGVGSWILPGEEEATDVPATYLSSRKIKRIASGDDDEPALLHVCSEVRNEALGIYYAQERFQLDINIYQLDSLSKWISSILARFGVARSQDTVSLLGSLRIKLESFEWSELGSLLPLARIAQVHGSFFRSPCAVSLGRARNGRRHRFTKIVEEVIRIGIEAAKEDLHEDLLGIKFEEYLEKICDSVGARRRYGLANVAGRDVGLPGDWYGTDEQEADDFDAPAFGRGNKANGFGTSDRKLRSSG